MSPETTAMQRFLRGSTRRAPEPSDPADMGTCIGLDMILDQPPLDPDRAEAPPRSWWQRLSGRLPPVG